MAASINYLMAFLTIKIYFNLETTLSLPGVAMLYCVVSTLGLLLMFNILPETENRSLEDIELHFSDKSKRITNHKIPKRQKLCNDQDPKEIITQSISMNGMTAKNNGKY